MIAITSKGVILACGPTQLANAKFDTREFSVPRDLISPAIVRSGSGSVALAAIESDGGAHVLISDVAIP
jgi:hypothetical protein